MKIVLLSHLLYSGAASGAPGENSDVFLLRTVHRINRWIKPDLVVIAGGLTEHCADTGEEKSHLAELAAITGMIEPETIVLRGIHDLPREIFYSVLPGPPDHIDLGNYRFAVFDDPAGADGNPARTQEEIRRGNILAENFSGRTIFLQSSPLFQIGLPADTESYRNADEILAGGKIFLALGGHAGGGASLLRHGDGTSHLCAPGLCRKPYPYWIVTLDDDKISASEETLATPEGCRDSHIHTEFAYCQENMDPARTLSVLRASGVKGFALTEHSGHLYASKEDYWSGILQGNGLAETPRKNRTGGYWNLLDRLSEKASFLRGMELDVDRFGRIVVLPEDAAKLEFKLGAVHWLHATEDREALKRDFLMRTEALLAFGCRVIAHPFRVFAWAYPPVPEELFLPAVKLLKRYGAAAEINFHHNEPSEKFFRLCLENGVKTAFGSDSHNLYELGEFYAHWKFLRSIGGSKDDLFFPEK